MLTIEDIRNSDRKSGFDHVNASSKGAGRSDPNWWTAVIYGGTQNKAGVAWRGRRRRIAEEAAQDYCDYVNGRTMLTIEDLRNPLNLSGYRHVGIRNRPGPGATGYAAQVGSAKDATGRSLGRCEWFGRRRKTADEAAQDACDYINGQRTATPTLLAWPKVEIDMGNTTRHAPKPEPIKIERKEFVGPHDLYDVKLYHAGGALVCRKVGITAKGHSRYADVCRTFGLSIKAHAQATTYPTKKAAAAAETLKIAEVCSDPAWRRVGKESFYPNEGTTA